MDVESVIKFAPVYKPVIWGGTRIAAFKGVPAPDPHVGESWELSAMAGRESTVSEGPLAGQTLPQLIERYGAELLGSRCGGEFPLLIKLIDSNDDLSIQVHPDDALARKRHGCPGKTELWYSIDPLPGAYLYAGFNRRMTPEEFRRRIGDNTLTQTLRRFPVGRGDVFFLPAGRVHSIGRGNLVLEIQQACDVSYRIYDYGRPRELHIDESLAAVDFADTSAEAHTVHPRPGKFTLVESCEHFTVRVGRVVGPTAIPLLPGESFTALTSISGNAVLRDAAGRETRLHQGETALVPASTGRLTATGPATIVTVAYGPSESI